MRRGIPRLAIAVLASGAALLARAAPAAADQVLRVGSYHGIPGQYKDIQAAIKAAKPNDWVLIAPGDYKEARTLKPKAPTTMTGPEPRS